MANIEVTITAEIEAAPDAVFAVLTDPARMPEWANGVKSGEWVKGSTATPGSKFKMLYRYGKRSHDITMEITATELNATYQYHTIKGPYPIDAKFILTPTANGTSLSYTQNAFSDSKLATLGFVLTRWIAKPMIRRTLRKDLAKLSEAVKGGPEDPSLE